MSGFEAVGIEKFTCITNQFIVYPQPLVMVVVGMSLEEMMEHIGFTDCSRYDYLVPIELPDCPLLYEWVPPFDYETPPKIEELPGNSDLWIQFMDERYSGIDEILEILNPRSERGRERPHGGGLLGVTLENAFYNGNQNNPLLPVSVKVFEGERGLIIRVRDSGAGFDFGKVTETVEELGRKGIRSPKPDRIPEEERFYRRKGGGFFMYVWHPAFISFENEGTTINIMYEYRPNPEILKLLPKRGEDSG